MSGRGSWWSLTKQISSVMLNVSDEFHNTTLSFDILVMTLRSRSPNLEWVWLLSVSGMMAHSLDSYLTWCCFPQIFSDFWVLGKAVEIFEIVERTFGSGLYSVEYTGKETNRDSNNYERERPCDRNKFWQGQWGKRQRARTCCGSFYF